MGEWFPLLRLAHQRVASTHVVCGLNGQLMGGTESCALTDGIALGFGLRASAGEVVCTAKRKS